MVRTPTPFRIGKRSAGKCWTCLLINGRRLRACQWLSPPSSDNLPNSPAAPFRAAGFFLPICRALPSILGPSVLLVNHGRALTEAARCGYGSAHRGPWCLARAARRAARRHRARRAARRHRARRHRARPRRHRARPRRHRARPRRHRARRHRARRAARGPRPAIQGPLEPSIIPN